MPSDSDLWPDELPFTAFGQWGEGRLDSRVFEQDVDWVDFNGVPHLISEMSPVYVRNVVAFLVRDVDEFHLGAMLREDATLVGELLLGRRPAMLAALDAGAPATADLDPLVWLEATPLMRRLRRRLAPDRSPATGSRSEPRGRRWPRAQPRPLGVSRRTLC